MQYWRAVIFLRGILGCPVSSGERQRHDMQRHESSIPETGRVRGEEGGGGGDGGGGGGDVDCGGSVVDGVGA